MQCYSKGILSLLKKSLSISKYLYSFKRVSTPIRCNLFTKDDGNFTADLQNVSFMSLDESIGKIEVDAKEEASVSKKVAPNRCGNPFERI
jgi:hypothetical protein